MDEVWRDIPGYVGLYQISDLGRVRSLCWVSPAYILSGVRIPKKIRRQGVGYAGRLGVALCREGAVHRWQVHRLVLTAHVGPCPEGMECLHGDGDHTNNKLSNLRWGTRKENMADKKRHGTQTCGESHHASRLTEAQVRAIRLDYRPSRAVAADYEVSFVTVLLIRKRKIWGHLK